MLKTDEYYLYDCEGTAEYLCKKIKEAEEGCIAQGYTDIRFELVSEWDYGDSEIPRLQVSYKRPPTDKELKQDTAQIARQETLERDNYLRLKAKFESK